MSSSSTDSSIVTQLVGAGKLRQSEAVLLLEKLSEHKVTFEELQAIPDALLVKYLTQNFFTFTITEQIHLCVAIKSRSVSEQKPIIPAVAKIKTTKSTKSPRREKTLSQTKKRKVQDHYEILETLAVGGFSEVRRGLNKKTNEVVAIKIIKKGNPDKLLNVKREIELMQKLNHPNIVCLKDVFEDEAEDGKIYMVMEYVSGGELFDHIVSRGSYSEHDAAVIVRQIIEAVAYLHSNNIAHRDLKPENLLCTGPNNEIIKVADFGLSKEFETSTATMCGTPDYVAPEVIKSSRYTNAVDVWSIGVITYVMLCGSPPFYGHDDREVFKKIISGDFKFFSPEWDCISNEAKQFIKALLETDSNRRPTAAQCLEAPWIKSSAQVGKTLVSEAVTRNIKDHATKRKKNN